MIDNKDKDKKLKPIKSIGSNILLWICIILVSVTLLEYFSSDNKPKNISYSEYKDYLMSDMIDSAVIEGRTFIGTLKEESSSSTSDSIHDTFLTFKAITDPSNKYLMGNSCLLVPFTSLYIGLNEPSGFNVFMASEISRA